MAKPKMKKVGTGNRVIVVFGPPSSGVSTVVNALSNASETSNIVVPYYGPRSLPDVHGALSQAEVVFVDVDGGVFDEEDVQGLNDARAVHTGSGGLVRLYASDADCMARSEDRPDYINPGDLRAWSRRMPTVEERIRTHNLNYFMIPNQDLEEAVKTLALRANISR